MRFPETHLDRRTAMFERKSLPFFDVKQMKIIDFAINRADHARRNRGHCLVFRFSLL